MNKKRNRNICKGIVLWLLLGCLLLGACGGTGNPGGTGTSQEGQSAPSDNWKKGFAGSGQDLPQTFSGVNAPYHSVSSIPVNLKVKSASVTDRRETGAFSDQESVFLFSDLTREGWRYYLERRDLESGDFFFDDQILSEEDLQGHFDSLCFTGENELAAVFVSEDGDGNPEEIRVYTLDGEGKKTACVTLDYLYQEIGSGPMMAYPDFFFDGSYFYLINCYEGGLLVFDKEGKEIRRDMPNLSEGRYYTGSCAAPDGSVITTRVNMENMRTEIILLTGEKETRLGEIPGNSYRQIAMREDGSFYYVRGDWLIRWDTASGEQTPLLNCGTEGVDPTFLAAITFSDDGSILLYNWGENGENQLDILTCSECSEEEAQQAKEKLSFAIVEEYSSLYYSALPVEYSKRHPENPVRLETYEGEFEAYRTRLMADILNGGGPDILLLEKEDMRSLYENGALLDLTEYLDPELKEKIFPSALARGTLDGKLIGVDPALQGMVILASNAAWEGDSWTIEDIVRLADEKKPKILYGYVNVDGTVSSNSPENILYYFLSFFPEKTSFLDLESGTCDFENETFIRFLELCKEYGEKPDLDAEQFYEALQTGECFATDVSLYNMDWFSRGMKPLEKSCHFVGAPGQEGYGPIGSYDFIAINANSKNKEKALQFLWDMLSPEEQIKLVDGTSVREDVIRDCVKEPGSAPGLTKNAGYSKGGGSYLLLDVKEDGSSFLEEFITAVGNLEPQDERGQLIYDMIEEEADLYFGGSRTAAETAKVIQNRVKLYLDENK